MMTTTEAPTGQIEWAVYGLAGAFVGVVQAQISREGSPYTNARAAAYQKYLHELPNGHDFSVRPTGFEESELKKMQAQLQGK